MTSSKTEWVGLPSLASKAGVKVRVEPEEESPEPCHDCLLASSSYAFPVPFWTYAEPEPSPYK